MMLVLYADDIIQRFGKIIPEKFAPAFFDVYKRWSDPDKGLFVGKKTHLGGVMPPFNQLFSGKNSNAIQTIFSILDEEFGEGYAKKNPNLIIKMIDELSKYRLQQMSSRE